MAELNGNNLILESKIDNIALNLKKIEENTPKEVVIKKEEKIEPKIDVKSPDQLTEINSQIEQFSKTLLLITNEINKLKTTISGLNNKINLLSKKQSPKQTFNKTPVYNNNYNVHRAAYQSYNTHKSHYVSEQDMKPRKNESPVKEQKKQDDGWTKVVSKRKHKNLISNYKIKFIFYNYSVTILGSTHIVSSS